MKKNLLELIENNIHYVKDELIAAYPNADITISDKDKEPLRLIEEILADTIAKQTEKSPIFQMDGDYGIRNQVLRNPQLQQKVEYSKLLDRAIISYENDIIHVGPKELGIYTTKEMLELEKELIELIERVPRLSLSVPEPLVNNFIKKKETDKIKMTSQQKNATYACTLANGPISLVEGYAGAGKSFTMGTVASTYASLGYGLLGVTLSWKAAEVLKMETSMDCISVTSFISRAQAAMNRRTSVFQDKQLVIIDEAGLVSLKNMVEIMRAIDNAQQHKQTKLILSGDSTQLAPINGPNALELMRRVLPDNAKATITEIRRQNSASHRQAVLLLRDGFSGEALNIYHQQESIKLCKGQREMINRVIADYFAAMNANPLESSLIIGLDNKMVREISQTVQNYLIKMGKVDPTKSMTIPSIIDDKTKLSVSQRFCVGDKIVFLKQNTDIKHIDNVTGVERETFLMNKSTGFIRSIKPDGDNGFDVIIDMKSTLHEKATTHVKINTKAYSDNGGVWMGLNYAITGYSSQGQTVQRAFLLDSSAVDRPYSYVCCSRHKESFHLYVDTDELYADMKKNKRYRQEKAQSEMTTIDYLNYIGYRWNKRLNKESIIVKLINFYEDARLINMERKKNGLTQLDENNPSQTFWKEYEKLQIKKHQEELRKSFYQKTRFNEILDTVDYYSKQPDRIDFKKVLNIPEEEAANYPVPLQEKKVYHLSELLTPELFKRYQGKLFDIGRGGDIRFIATSDDNVISKYNMFGEDMLQMGYPYMINSGRETNEVFIVQDLNMFLSLWDRFYLNNNTYGNPTIIWGTKDTKYGYISDAMTDCDIWVIGDEEYKTNQFFKLIKAKETSPLKAKFKNISKQVLDSVAIDELGQQLDFVEFSERNTQLGFEITNSKTNNAVCNMHGHIYNDLLREILVENNVMKTDLIDNEVLPSRVSLFEQPEQKIEKTNEPKI